MVYVMWYFETLSINSIKVSYILYLSFPLQTFMQIMKELHSLKQIRGPDPNYNDICFSGAGRYCIKEDFFCFYKVIYLLFHINYKTNFYFRNVSQLSNTFPAVDMVFSGGQKLSLSPENYLFRVSD